MEFEPTARVLRFAQRELDALGAAGGGAVEAEVRRSALARYANFGAEQLPLPPGWRHEYATLPFPSLTWSTGRAGVAAPRRPRATPVRKIARDEDTAALAPEDVPALASENSGGLVHAGSTYLAAPPACGDPRVTLLPLADAKRSFPERVRRIHQRIVRPEADRFTALATAFQNCGAYVEIPGGVALGAPLQLLWTARPGAAAAVFPHTVIRLGTGAQATIIERHTAGPESFVCAIVEADLAPGARLDYVALQQTDEAARIVSRRGARCAAGATIGWHLAELGGALARSALEAKLLGARANAEVNALFFAGGFANIELELALEQAAAATSSRAIVRTAASERGRGRVRGECTVSPRAPGSTLDVRSDALLLARRAYLDVFPAFAVTGNGIAARYDGSVGSLAEESVFYVESRGIPRASAERMLALAFFEPAIARFPGERLRDEIRTALDERLDAIPETFA